MIESRKIRSLLVNSLVAVHHLRKINKREEERGEERRRERGRRGEEGVGGGRERSGRERKRKKRVPWQGARSFVAWAGQHRTSLHLPLPLFPSSLTGYKKVFQDLLCSLPSGTSGCGVVGTPHHGSLQHPLSVMNKLDFK